jgi:predicted ester cyclase
VSGGADSAEAQIARRALEEVCSSLNDAGFDELYAEDFVDHVNDSVYRGRRGARHSVAGYRRIFGDSYRFTIDEQLVDGNRVCSRFTLTGTYRSRHVQVWGLVTSRIENGQIVEDWAAMDTVAILRQLGLWRSLLLVVFQLAARRAV